MPSKTETTLIVVISPRHQPFSASAERNWNVSLHSGTSWRLLLPRALDVAGEDEYGTRASQLMRCNLTANDEPHMVYSGKGSVANACLLV